MRVFLVEFACNMADFHAWNKPVLNAAMPMACTVGELFAKNIEKTARRQLEGQHLQLENICGAEGPFIS